CAVLADIGWSVTSFCGSAPETNPPPSVPVVESPAEGATDVDLQPVFVWRAVVGAEFYEIELRTLVDPEIVFAASEIVDTTSSGTQLEEDTGYAWRVRAVSDAGTGEWTTEAAFYTRVSPPGPVTLIAPDEGSSNSPIAAPLQWAPADRAAYHRLELSTLAAP